jgi:ABC-type multidrug transport system ATPase subunit
MHGLLGANESSKSSVTLAISQQADSGAAMLDGLCLLNEKAEEQKITGYVP